MADDRTQTTASKIAVGLQEALSVSQGEAAARTHEFDIHERGDRVVLRRQVDGVKVGPVRIMRKGVNNAG